MRRRSPGSYKPKCMSNYSIWQRQTRLQLKPLRTRERRWPGRALLLLIGYKNFRTTRRTHLSTWHKPLSQTAPSSPHTCHKCSNPPDRPPQPVNISRDAWTLQFQPVASRSPSIQPRFQQHRSKPQPNSECLNRERPFKSDHHDHPSTTASSGGAILLPDLLD